MRKRMRLLAVALLIAASAGCAVHLHEVGSGGGAGNMTQERQWYVLWGLVPINQVDTDVMAAGASAYTIKTEQSALDVVINIFTSWVTVYSRTVTVTK